MEWTLPTEIKIGEKTHKIRNNCDYRVVLDVFQALTDKDLTDAEKIECSLFIFYENAKEIQDFETAVSEMMRILNGGRVDSPKEEKPRLMDWEFDFSQIAPPISRVLGYSVRDANKYTHWFDFLGAYMEIGECFFAQIVSIRHKKAKGKKLERHEQEFYEENRHIINLPNKLSSEDDEWLNSDF